ncbi:MAG: DUF167 domain-containing protein [Candidatus Staskawiczbacteria bacterium]|nr:DUF167 domain-containing protein [Candidatus Staskawiczbacteria bacterium]
MKIIVKAKTNSKENRVEKIDESNYVVYVKERPVDGKANSAIIKILADYFGTKSYFIEIISGDWSKTKIIEIKK